MVIYFIIFLFKKGLGKLASMMAQKGQGLISVKTWNEMHSEETVEYEWWFCRKYISVYFPILTHHPANQHNF